MASSQDGVAVTVGEERYSQGVAAKRANPRSVEIKDFRLDPAILGDHIRGLLANHDGRQVGVAGW